MKARKKATLGVAGLAGALALVFAAAVPASAGEWAWGSKNCIGTGSSYVYTHSGGTGNVTHYHQGYSPFTFANGSINFTRHKTFYSGLISGASVAGPSTNWASYNCSAT